MSKDGLGRRIKKESKLLRMKKSCLEFRAVHQEPSAIHVGVIIPSSSESMIPSGLQKTKSIANDFVPVITLNEQTSLALLGERLRPL